MSYWDSVADNDPVTTIRHGDWEEGIDADLAHLPTANAGDRILDLGCGIGRLSVAYAARYQAIVYGIDASSEMLARAAPHPLVRYWGCDGRTIPFGPPVWFAGAFSVLMFQHIPPDLQENYVRQVAGLLAPDGWFTFQVALGDETTVLSYQVRADEPGDWCERAGLTVEHVVEEDGWLWVTARR